ncbi:hypothetical protein [Streptomyces alboflavus]|uniref:hypothetical protein n=1 Tax=Streptomyces alboflavus TaxID=67267 RepID=UPI00068EB76D|nr:hypothetical protein [Streptomyces alboflavus]
MGSRKAVTAVAGIGVVALLGVGAYVGFGEGDDSGGHGGVGAAGGPHKLIAPNTVLGKYEQVEGITSAAMEDPAGFGVRGAKTVQAVYGSGRGAKAISAGLIQYTGAYGTVAAPEKTVDALFADLADRARKPGKGGEKSTMVGRPEDFGAAGVVVKCQETRTEGRSSAAPESRQVLRAPVCAWADRSTAAIVMPMDTRATKAGKAVSLAEAAATTKRLREEVRVAR